MPDQSSAATEHALIQEITAPLEGLPDDPLAYVDADFPVGMRGYDRHAVDEYVARTRRLVAELQATRSPEAAVRRALERVGSEVSGILQRAHETAEQITAQSRVEAEDRLEQARQEAAHIIAAAERRVRELDADTDRIWAERHRIITDAEDLSSQLLALAHDAGQRFNEEDAAAAADRAGEVGDSEVRDSEVGDAQGADAATHVGDAADVGEGPVFDHSAPLAQEGAPADAQPASGAAADDAVAGEPHAPEDDDDRDPGIDETVAFAPLRRPHDEDAPGGGTEYGPEEPPEYTPGGDAGQTPGPAAAGDESPPEPRPRRVGDEDSTRIIPPASDAANRRRQS